MPDDELDDPLPRVGTEDAEDEEEGDAVGRFSIRRAGWKAAGGGDVAVELPVPEPAITSCGIGARWLLAIDMYRKNGKAQSGINPRYTQKLTPLPKASEDPLPPTHRHHHPNHLARYPRLAWCAFVLRLPARVTNLKEVVFEAAVHVQLVSPMNRWELWSLLSTS